MTRLFQDVTSPDGMLKYYLTDDGKCLGSAIFDIYYFNDIEVEEMEEAVAGLQGMIASRHIKAMNEGLKEANLDSPIATGLLYAMFGHYIEAGNVL